MQYVVSAAVVVELCVSCASSARQGSVPGTTCSRRAKHWQRSIKVCRSGKINTLFKRVSWTNAILAIEAGSSVQLCVSCASSARKGSVPGRRARDVLSSGKGRSKFADHVRLILSSKELASQTPF